MSAVDGRAYCPAVEARCRCREDAGHEGAHVCPCGGSWLTDADGNFADVVTYPPAHPIPGLGAGEDW